MSSAVSGITAPNLPPDQPARERALDAARSVLVQAPAGSGKTDLLTRRFLRLLGQVDDAGEIVAITFTRAAAAEMRHRIVAELEKAAARQQAGRNESDGDERFEFSMEALAARAHQRSQARGWNLVVLPAQLRISTIDSFCRELAVQQPLLSGLGGGLEIFDEPRDLYRRAARHTLEQIDGSGAELRGAIERLLLWRDNGWQEMESLLVEMLAKRDQWLHDFVVEREQDGDALRARLQRPFARAVREKLAELSALLDRVPHARAEALALARFACAQTAGALYRELAEMAEFPTAPFEEAEQLEEAREACECLKKLLLTNDGGFRQKIDKTLGFPADRKAEKSRLLALIADLRRVPGLEQALAAVVELPPARYSEEDWAIVCACFALLRHAAAQLRVVFAEASAVDYIEVAQIAQQVLRGEGNAPGEAALFAADRSRHLLVDEFQDTNRRQIELLRSLIAAWPEREGRTCFLVGDPMQSIYFFRDADAALYPHVRDHGMEIAGQEPLPLIEARLSANFRTAGPLVTELNRIFELVFAADDGSGVTFAVAEPARADAAERRLRLAGAELPRHKLHLKFIPQSAPGRRGDAGAVAETDAAREEQTREIVELIRSHLARMEQARAEQRKYRVAVLGRTRSALEPIAAALREAAIPFRAVELEKLRERPEVMDALALARAVVNPHDRVAWLGVLRAPWSGLSLADLHALVSGDDGAVLARSVPELLVEREEFLTEQGRAAVRRVRQAYEFARQLRCARPTATLGTWMEQVWEQLGGAACVDAASRVNVELLWSCLDGLPNGEQDLTGAALDAALEKLTALPDPAAESDCGVQMMTIHKAKGLEFEVVIVPELQAAARRSHRKLLSWLERELNEPDESGDVTEFLVAPIQLKGADCGKANAWVEREIHRREAQEMRRLLYVAATRAREELHLFARPAYQMAADGYAQLASPRESLLATAWPAFEVEIAAQFEQWRAAAAPGNVETIAASSDAHLRLMPAAIAKPTLLRRLPADYRISTHRENAAGAIEPVQFGSGQLYARHEGGLLSRTLGTAVHALLGELAQLRATLDWDPARAALERMVPRIVARVRAAGVEPTQAERMAAQALAIALAASQDRVGQWILSPHREAASEVRWAAVAGDGIHAPQIHTLQVHTLQPDRVFRAGAQPGTEIGTGASAGGGVCGGVCDGVWWIVDFKTAHAELADAGKPLPELRAMFAPQLETYARVLRNLHGTDARICAGLYYPRMLAFDWWEI